MTDLKHRLKCDLRHIASDGDSAAETLDVSPLKSDAAFSREC
jgi:hypothetical protein